MVRPSRKYSCRVSSSTLSGGKALLWGKPPPFLLFVRGPVAFYALEHIVACIQVCAYLLRALYFTILIRLRLGV